MRKQPRTDIPKDWLEILKLDIRDLPSEKLGSVMKLILRAYTAEVNRRAESKMLKTGKLEGSHHAAMREINQELGL